MDKQQAAVTSEPTLLETTNAARVEDAPKFDPNVTEVNQEQPLPSEVLKPELNVRQKLDAIVKDVQRRDVEADKNLDKEVDEILKDAVDTEPQAAQAQATLPQPADTKQQEIVYTPNFKFKANNKEFEFDEDLRAVVTNADREKKLRELYEKAYGLDSVKAASQKTQEEYEQKKAEWGRISQGIDNLDQRLKRGDIDGFISTLKIPQETFVNWVLDKVKYQQATPEQRQQIDAYKAAQNQAWDSESRLSQLEQRSSAQQIALLQGEMDLTMSQPEVRSFAEAWDKQAGTQGAFFNFVKERGVNAGGGYNLSPKQVVTDTMALLRPHLRTDANPVQLTQTAPQASQGQSNNVASMPKPKVIANVQGTSASPVAGKSFSSVDDLRKEYKRLSGA